MKKLLLYTLTILLNTTFVAQEISPNFESSNRSILKNDDFLLAYEYKQIWDYSESVWEHNRYVIIEYNEYNKPSAKFEKWTEGSGDIYYTNLHYDDNQNLAIETKYEWIDDAWVDYTNTSYEYEGNNRTQKISQGWDGEQYINEIKNIYSYDENDKKIWQVMYYWEDGAWAISQEFDFQYDENGNLYKILTKALIDDEWRKYQKIVYTYDTTNRLLYLEGSMWDTENSNWEHAHHKQVYTYDENNNRIILVMQQWNEYNSEWDNLYKSSYYYVMAGSENVENTNSGINKSIEDFQTTEDDIVIDPGREDKVLTCVEVLIDTVWHTSVGDLEFTLSHNGISETIIYHAGGDGDNFFNTKLSDLGADSLMSGIAPFYGIYKPENPLSAFLETDPAGTWTLSIYDSADGNTGILQQWGLNLIYSSGASAVEDDISNRSDLVVFPNPASSVCNLQSTVFSQQSSTIQIYDLHGKKLFEQYILKGTTTAEINVKNLENGMYFCKISTGKDSATKKLIIQK